MRSAKLLYIFIICSSLGLLSCTEAPLNDPESKAGPRINALNLAPTQAKNFNLALDRDQPQKPGQGASIGDGSPEELELREKNLNKPIVYGVGAGGITLDTTLKQTKTLLTPPRIGPTEDGHAIYNEALYVIYSLNGDRLPSLIIAMKGYLGKIDAGPMGKISMQTQFDEYRGEGGLERLINEFYQVFEKPEDPNYDCLAARQCRLIVGDGNQANIVILLPGIVFLLAKEEFQMSEIRIIRNTNPEALDSHLDILTGTILSPDKERKLGDSFESIIEGIGSQPEIYTSYNSVGYSWRGVWYSFHRTNYANTVSQAEPNDPARAVVVQPPYSSLLTVNGTPIIYKVGGDTLTFEVQSQEENTEADKDPQVPELQGTGPFGITETPLNLNLFIPKFRSEMFVQNLTDFLKTELKKEYDKVHEVISGVQNTEVVNREISSSILAFDSSSRSGIQILFQVNEEQQRFDFFQVSLVNETLFPFLSKVLPTYTEPVAKALVQKEVTNPDTGAVAINPQTGQPITEVVPADNYRTLAGISIGDIVQLSEIDALGRGEATANLWDLSSRQPLLPQPERVGFSERDVFYSPNQLETNRLEPNDMSFISTSAGTLGARYFHTLPDGSQLYKVNAITSGSFQGELEGICSMADQDLSLVTGMSSIEVQKQIEEAIKSQQAQNPSFQCLFYPVFDNGDKNRLVALQFPDDNLMINFSDKNFVSVTIYEETNLFSSFPSLQPIGGE